MTVLRLSPLHHHLEALEPTWRELNGMPAAWRLRPAAGVAVQLADCSALDRIGLKGPGAIDWLRAGNLPVPGPHNTWLPIDRGLIARLGRGEFLIEDALGGSHVAPLRAALSVNVPRVYPVLRQDAALLMRGERVHELLAQVCNVDFSAIPPRERAVTLTMMAGVSVTILRTALDDTPCYRIWCDATLGVYLWETLAQIGAELGGGVAGLAEVLPEAAALQ